MTPDGSTVGIIDAYTSLIWTKRYHECGDFELYLPVSHLDILKIGNFVYRLDDDATMLIEKIEIKTDIENGNFLTVTGRSAECLLARRIVWGQVTYSGTVETLMHLLVQDNVITPSDTARAIPNIVAGVNHGITESLRKQISYENLLDAISELCQTYNLGFRFLRNENNQFALDIYQGTEIPEVTFSTEFDNLVNSFYQYDTTNYANTVLVAGEGEGINRTTQAVGTSVGLSRYELFVDARNLSSTTSEPITADEYAEILAEKGEEELGKKLVNEAFEGEIETSGTYEYKVDWNLGDVVNLENEYGISAVPRIVGVIEKDDVSGRAITAIFSTAIPVGALRDSNGNLLYSSDGYLLMEGTQ